MSKTYTNGPLTAREILDELFASPTCESPWFRVYAPALNYPVYDVDCMGGKKLGAAVTEISEKLGTVFTLMGGRYTLVWTVKGTGEAPSFPANSDRRRVGRALSGNPTRVRILGERNVYQVLDVPLEPDWLRAWEEFWDVDYLRRDLFTHESNAAGQRLNALPGDVTGLQGWYAAAAWARTITVGEYADLRDARDANGGDAFRDYRKLGGRSRLQMPAALYIAMVVFRAFRPVTGFTVLNAYNRRLDLWSLELIDKAICEVWHDPVTGAMSWDRDVISAGNGYAIAKGYKVSQDAFKTLRPQQVRVADWLATQEMWEHVSFQLDDSGEGSKFLLFDTQVIKSADVIRTCTINGEAQPYPVLNAQPVFEVPPVRAALVFAGENYSYVAGCGTRDEVHNEGGLSAEFVAWYGDDRNLVELAYADGLTANQKASALADMLLNRQWVYDLGGYVVQGINGTPLSPVIDRGDSGVEREWDD